MEIWLVLSSAHLSVAQMVWILQMACVFKQIWVVLKPLRKYCSCHVFRVIEISALGSFSQFSIFAIALSKAQLMVVGVWLM